MNRRASNKGISPWVTFLFVILFVFCVVKLIDNVHAKKEVQEPEVEKPVWTGQ